jgi:hypothetical protein
MLGIGPSCSCKGWSQKLNILLVPSLYTFSLITSVFNKLDNFKINSSWHDFNTRSKNQLPFPSVKLTSVKKSVAYSAIKVFNHLPLNTLELQENKTFFKTELGKYLLTHVFYSVEKFFAYNNDKKQ